MVVGLCIAATEVGNFPEQVLETQKRANALAERVFVANHRVWSARIGGS